MADETNADLVYLFGTVFDRSRILLIHDDFDEEEDEDDQCPETTIVYRSGADSTDEFTFKDTRVKEIALALGIEIPKKSKSKKDEAESEQESPLYSVTKI